MGPGRQLLLREVGSEGQAKIAAAVAIVSTHDPLEKRVCERYLAGAGFTRIEAANARTDGEADALARDTRFSEMHPSARAIALGAVRALEETKRALGLTENA